MASVNGFSWVSLWRRKGLVFKELFLLILIFFASNHYMEEMSLFLRLFLLIFLAFLFDFLGYQTQSSKIITFFVNYFFEEKRTKKEKKRRSTAMLLILRRKRKEISENESLVHKWTIQNFKIWISNKKESCDL